MFDIVTAKDFYAAVVQDFDDFVAEPSSARRAMHCAITAYHLHEWVWGDWLSKDEGARQALGIAGKSKALFLEWIDRHCPWFSSVQELANGTKHFTRSVESMRVGGFGEGPYSVGPYGQGYLLIDWGEGAGPHRWQPAITLLEVVVRFWRDFFVKYQPSPDLAVSPHHVN